MRIALLGGTGDIGQGLALRWAYDSNHEIVLGSRDPEKARTKAEEYETELDSLGRDRKVTGFVNEMAADRADVVVLAVPAYHVSDTVEAVTESLNESILVTPAVGMSRDDDGFHYNPPPHGSVAALAAEADLEADIDWDTPVFGDDTDAKETVMQLAADIEGLRPLDAGGLANAAEVESLTPLLINLARENDGLHDLGVKFW
jgi:predicted dinucleotide-binding enzyme